MAKINKCPICGSTAIRLIDKKGDEDFYYCDACDHQSVISNVIEVEEAPKEVNALPKELNAVELFKKSVNSVYRISSTYSCGTAFAIDNHHLITNAHVVHDTKKGEAPNCKFYISKFNEDTVTEVEVLGYDDVTDIAVLYNAILMRDHLSWVRRPIEIGEACYIIGNSNGTGLAIVDGIVSDNARNIHNGKCIMTSAHLSSGNSGGPLLDRFGRVMSVNVSQNSKNHAMNFSIHHEVVEKVIKKILKEE